MRIDITIIDKRIIYKNKQIHQFDGSAYAFYVIAEKISLNKFSSRVAKRGNEVLVELCQLISFMIDEYVSVYLLIALAHTLNEMISVQYLL